MNLISKVKHWIQHHHLPKQFGRFIVIGLGSTIISYIAFLTCLHAFKLHYIIANIVGFIFGVGFGYYFNKRWTFDAHDSKNFHSYFAVYIGSLIISIIILKITVDFIGIIPEIAFILSIGITTFTNFLGTKFLVFKK